MCRDDGEDFLSKFGEITVPIIAMQSIESSENRLGRVTKLFVDATFIRELGVKLTQVSKGACEAKLDVQAWMKHKGSVHTCVLASLADHTAMGAALSFVDAKTPLKTAEFKMNSLCPAIGDSLCSRAKVTFAGSSVLNITSEVFSVQDSRETLVATATVAIAIETDSFLTRKAFSAMNAVCAIAPALA